MNVKDEIQHATMLCQKLEDLVVNRKQLPNGYRDRLLSAHWSLLSDYQKSIIALLNHELYGGAFALQRPLVEALIRAHIVLIGDEEEVRKIMSDEYRANFKTVGAQIDTAFNLEGLLDRFLNGVKGVLHSFTHSGLSQLARRFKKDSLEPNYTDEEIIELIHNSCSAFWMVTNLVTKSFKFDDEASKAQDLYVAWGKETSSGTRA
ncbi:MAG: hypothetical protein GZ088_15230 [Acidipila sp.]|nr:hypothetical protein [Acidipila sp.]